MSPQTTHMATITHTPYPYKRQREITLDMVDKLYVGKGNNCRCGCGGNYYEPAEHAKKIERSIKKFASGKYEVHSQDDYIFEIVLSERDGAYGRTQTYVHTLYLKK